MPRLKLVIEYDGTPFVGWQLQAGGPSVQGLIAEAIAAFSGERVAVFGAGRTDAGVHALGQVAHFDLTRDWRADRVRDALNARLRPQLIAVLSAEKVDAGFDARFSAKRRHDVSRSICPRPPAPASPPSSAPDGGLAGAGGRGQMERETSCRRARRALARRLRPRRPARGAVFGQRGVLRRVPAARLYLPARGGKGGLP